MLSHCSSKSFWCCYFKLFNTKIWFLKYQIRAFIEGNWSCREVKQLFKGHSVGSAWDLGDRIPLESNPVVCCGVVFQLHYSSVVSSLRIKWAGVWWLCLPSTFITCAYGSVGSHGLGVLRWEQTLKERLFTHLLHVCEVNVCCSLIKTYLGCKEVYFFFFFWCFPQAKRLLMSFYILILWGLTA